MLNFCELNLNSLNFFSIQSVTEFLERKIVWIQSKTSLLLKNRSHDRFVEKIVILSTAVFFVCASLVMLARRGNWIKRVTQKKNAPFSKFPVGQKTSMNVDGKMDPIDLKKSFDRNEDLRSGRLVLAQNFQLVNGWFELKDRLGRETYFYNLQSGQVLEKEPPQCSGGVCFQDDCSALWDCTNQIEALSIELEHLLFDQVKECIALLDFEKDIVHLKYCQQWKVPEKTILDLWIYNEIVKGVFEIASSCPKIKDKNQKWEDFNSLKNSFKNEKKEIEDLINKWAEKNASHVIVNDDIKKGGVKTMELFPDLIHSMRNLFFTIERLGRQKCFLPVELIGVELPFHRDCHLNVEELRLNSTYNLTSSSKVKFCYVLFPPLLHFSKDTTYGVHRSLVAKV